MDLEIILLSEVSQTEKETYPYDITYVESKKWITLVSKKWIQVNLCTKQK